MMLFALLATEVEGDEALGKLALYAAELDLFQTKINAGVDWFRNVIFVMGLELFLRTEIGVRHVAVDLPAVGGNWASIG